MRSPRHPGRGVRSIVVNCSALGLPRCRRGDGRLAFHACRSLSLASTFANDSRCTARWAEHFILLFSRLFRLGGAFHSHFMCCMCQKPGSTRRFAPSNFSFFLNVISVAHSCSPYSPILIENVWENSQTLCVSVLCMCECLSSFFLKTIYF